MTAIEQLKVLLTKPPHPSKIATVGQVRDFKKAHKDASSAKSRSSEELATRAIRSIENYYTEY